MQDKYTIGSVTIVQLVGLQAKPKIASAQSDGAVRAADPVPPSAAAGFGNDLSLPIDEIAASSYNLKAAPSLGLVPSPLGARIALEAGADRPVADANAHRQRNSFSCYNIAECYRTCYLRGRQSR